MWTGIVVHDEASDWFLGLLMLGNEIECGMGKPLNPSLLGDSTSLLILSSSRGQLMLQDVNGWERKENNDARSTYSLMLIKKKSLFAISCFKVGGGEGCKPFKY